MQLMTEGSEAKIYTSGIHARCSVVQTLARRTPYEINDIYIPLTLKACVEKKDVSIQLDNTISFSKDYPRSIVVDSAGMGKSILSKKLVVDRAERGQSIPFFYELRSIDESFDFVSDIYRVMDTFTNHGDEINDLVYVVFDGIDEIRFDCYDEVIESITKFITTTDFPCLITSRIVFQFSHKIINELSLDEGKENPNKKRWMIPQFHIQALKRNEIYRLIHKLGDPAQSEKLIKLLNDSKNTEVHKYLGRPLFVTLLYRAFDFEGQIPPKPHMFYEVVFRALFSDHDKTKDPSKEFQRNLRTNLDSTQLHKILRRFSVRSVEMSFKLEYSQTEFSNILGDIRDQLTVSYNADDLVHDLLKEVPLLMLEGTSVHWIHKSMMEYFVASFIQFDAGDNKLPLIKSLINGNSGQYENIILLFSDMDSDTYEIAMNLSKIFTAYISFRQRLRDQWQEIDESLFDFVASSLFSHGSISRGRLIQNSDRKSFQYVFKEHPSMLSKITLPAVVDEHPSHPTQLDLPAELFREKDWKTLELYARRQSVNVGGGG